MAKAAQIEKRALSGKIPRKEPESCNKKKDEALLKSSPFQ
jgi:hypothetical protein